MINILNFFSLPKCKDRLIIPKKKRLPRKTKKAMCKNLHKTTPRFLGKPYVPKNTLADFLESLRGKSLVVTNCVDCDDGSTVLCFELSS